MAFLSNCKVELAKITVSGCFCLFFFWRGPESVSYPARPWLVSGSSLVRLRFVPGSSLWRRTGDVPEVAGLVVRCGAVFWREPDFFVCLQPYGLVSF